MKQTLKKSLSIILAAAILICSAPITALVGFPFADYVSEFFDSLAPKAEAATSGTCGASVYWNLDEETGTLTISGSGDMYDWTSELDVPWFNFNKSIVNIIISESITNIGDCAFSYCTEFASITLPESVAYIGKSAFENCSALSEIEIPNGTEIINYRAFYNCINLKNVELSDSVTFISDNAFYDCNALESITLGKGVATIGYNAFFDCVNLTDVNYNGTETEWNAISVDEGNECLTGATIHFNDTPVESEPHEHSYTSSETIPATCSKVGILTYICTECGDTYTEAIPKTEHIVNSDALWLTEIPSTCTEEGRKFRRCSVCKEPAEFDTITALGHNFGGWETTTTPSCEGTGEKTRTCTVCKFVEREILNANGHKPADDWTVVTSATCTTDGKKVKKCTVCTLNVESEVIPALGHNPETSWEIIKEATCTEEGIRSCRCTRCIYSVTETIPAKGHALEDEWKTVTPATCTQSGTTARFCENCEYSLTRDIPAKGHAVGEWEIIKKADCKNTGTKVKRCTNCNNIIQSEAIPVSGHTGGNWVITRTPENGSYGIKSKFCTGCGIKLEEKIIYSINSATVKDYSTGVEIIYAKETFDGNAAISARALSGSELSDRIYNKFGECIFKGYEAVLLNDGIPTVPANSYSLRLPVPEGFNRRNAEVYAVDMNTGELYAVSASYDNGYFLIDKVDAVQYVIVERIINISLSETSLSMKKGGSVQLYAETNGYGVTYTSSDPSVATVDIHGNVTAVGSGSAVITASVDGSDVKAECTVEVTQSFFEMIIDAFSSFFKMIAGLFGL